MPVLYINHNPYKSRGCLTTQYIQYDFNQVSLFLVSVKTAYIVYRLILHVAVSISTAVYACNICSRSNIQ